MLTSIMRRGSASARYFAWTCALAAVLLVPVLSRVLPTWEPIPATPVVRSLEPTDAVLETAVAPREAIRANASPVRSSFPWLAAIWLGGVLVSLGRLAAGHLRLWISLRRASEVRGTGWLASAVTCT